MLSNKDGNITLCLVYIRVGWIFRLMVAYDQLDDISIWSNQALLTSYAVAAGLQLLAPHAPLRNMFGVVTQDWRAWLFMVPVTVGSSFIGV
jgi:hypothetical protein